MGIVLGTFTTQPAVDYKYVHLCKLEINQPVFTNNLAVPVYEVVIYFRMYGIDLANTRHYADGEPTRIGINDFIALATQKAAAGDTSLATALSSIEKAVASIIASQMNVTSTVVV